MRTVVRRKRTGAHRVTGDRARSSPGDPFPVRPMRRLAPLALLSLAALLAACEMLPPWLGGDGPPPFALFGRSDMRPGVSFAELDGASRREGPRRFFCSPLWARAQSCKIQVAPGEMRAIVDSTGRVIRLMIVAPDSFFDWDYTPREEPRYRIYANELRTAWDSIRPHRFGSTERNVAEFRWVDGEGQWTGQMWYSPWSRYRTRSAALRAQYRDSLARVPDSIAVTDEPVYSRLIALRPPPDTEPTPARKVDRMSPPVEILPEPAASPPPVARADPAQQHWASAALADALQALARAQQRHHAKHGKYAADVRALRLVDDPNVTLQITRTNATGWAAVAIHQTMPTKSCVYYVGSDVVPPSTFAERRPAVEAQVVCDPY